MIPLLPYQRLIFESPLSKEEVVRRLTLEVATRQFGWRWSDERTETFEGTVSEESFQINRIIRYRNSFLPVIQGRISPHARGVQIAVTMRLHVAVLIFSIVWLSFVGFGVTAFVSEFLETRRVEVGALIPIGMMIFFYLMVTIGFGVEANKASKLLGKIFDAVDSGA